MKNAAGVESAYTVETLRELMDNIGGWSNSWDDVVMYLEGPARTDAAFPAASIPALVRDVGQLRDVRARFTRDYRKVWQRLTGENAAHLPPPAHADPHAIDPFEVQVDYLADLQFPASKRDLLRAARQNAAPTRVMEQIEALQDREFNDRNALLEELDDANWCTQKPAERTRIPGGGRP